MDSRNPTQSFLNNSCHKLLVKILSLLDTIVLRTLCSFTTESKKILAISWAENGCVRLIKCPNFVSLSTTTRITSLLLDFGNPPMLVLELPKAATCLGMALARAYIFGMSRRPTQILRRLAFVLANRTLV